PVDRVVPVLPFTPNLNFLGGDDRFFRCIFWMPFTSGTRVAGVLVGPARPAPVRPPAHLVDGVVGAARDGDVDPDHPRAVDDREVHTGGDRVDGRCERDGGEEALEAELALSPVMATPAAWPTSSKVPSPRLWKSRFGPMLPPTT